MKNTLITGAASGLGRALAVRLADAGQKVIAVDEDAASINHLVSERPCISQLTGDLTDLQVQRRVLQKLGDSKLDLVLHCASISATGPFEMIPAKNHYRVASVNLIVPIQLSCLLLEYDRVNTNATMVFVSSLSYFTGYPGASCYAGTKDGLASYARSLAKAKPHLNVLEVFPGPINTEHARRYSPDKSVSAANARMSADDVARSIVCAIDRKNKICLPGYKTKIAAIAGYFAPQIVGKILRKSMYLSMDGTQL